MKILLVGGTGMVGRNILELNEELNLFEIIAPSRNELDLESLNSIDKYLLDFKPDFIINSAGFVGGIQHNLKNPVNFLVKNLDINRNLILSAKSNGIKKLINLSSSCMYPRNADNPLKESYLLKGELEPTNEGYALAKLVATRLCEYINKEDDYYQYKTAILCNLYGRYDKFSPQKSHMIPAGIRKIHKAKLNDENVTIWGTGEVRREFMYAKDVANFIFYAIDNFDRMPQNLNVGLGYDYTVNEYYDKIAKIVGFKGEFEHDLTKPVGMKQKVIDNTRLKEFGWEPKTSLDEGLVKTYEFYKNII